MTDNSLRSIAEQHDLDEQLTIPKIRSNRKNRRFESSAEPSRLSPSSPNQTTRTNLLDVLDFFAVGDSLFPTIIMSTD